MERRISLFAGFAVLGAVVIIGWSLANQPAKLGTESTEPARKVPLPVPLPAADTVPVLVLVTAPGSSPPPVEILTLEAASGDAGRRAAAITALAKSPRAEAVPVLGRILTNGEPEIDRPLALRSLRDLALNQGDADGAIREAVRGAIYHGDDFTKAYDLQEVLEIIEESQQRQ